MSLVYSLYPQIFITFDFLTNSNYVINYIIFDFFHNINFLNEMNDQNWLKS
jgi:hypothetical protein